MHVAYITTDPGVPIFGQKGCSIHVQEVLRGMARLGVSLELFATHCQGTAPRGLANIPLHPLLPFPKGDLAFREQACLGLNETLQKALQSQGPFNLVYERYSIWSFAGMEYARDNNIPGLLEINAPLIEEQALHRGLINRRGAEQVADRAFAAASALIAVSDEVADYLKSFPSARGKIHIIPNGVNPSLFPVDLKPTLPSAAASFTVGFVGSMKPWHGLENLIEAFALLYQRSMADRLLLVGDGTVRQQLAEQVRARGLGEAVHFTGAVLAEEVPGLLASMDVGVAPYPAGTRFYFSPLKVYEYMAAGLPVVASRLGQLEKLIESEKTGLLVPPGDVPALVGSFERLRSDRDLRQRLGRAARAQVFENHTWDGVVEQILKLARTRSKIHSEDFSHART
jgi:glycosyltransferase involved in cell wall biosynthesis